MKNIKYMLMIAALLIAAQTASAVVIQSVTHNSANAIELGGILDSGDYYSPARTSHVYKNNPAEPLMDLGRSLFGKAEFIRVSHLDREKADYQMTVTLATSAQVYLFIDKRVSTVATKMPWVAQMGFVDTGKIMTFDESNNGSFENPFEIYTGKLGAGVHILKQQASGTINMYGVAAVLGDPIAQNPNPADKQGLVTDPLSPLYPGVLTDTNLSWSAPVDPTIDPNFPIEYRVYMDPNQTKVTTGTGCEHFLDFTTAIGYNPATDLPYEATYYWRVDANIHFKGKTDPNVFTVLWSFKTAAQDKAPIAQAGNSIRTWLAKAQSGTVQLQGSVLFAEADSTSRWTAYKMPLPETVPAPEVTFANESSPTTTVTISATGEYILQLTATDDTPSIPASTSQMRVFVYADACEAAKNTAGYAKNAYDFDGNCAVDMKDLATFAARWLISTSATADILYAAVVGDPVQALVAEYWTNIPGTDPNLLLNSPNYPNDPNGSNLVVGQFKQLDRGIDNYGQRIRGYIVAPTTGDYTFYISSDDSSRLFLSTDTNPANAVMIASVTGSTGLDAWTAQTSQTSVAKSLTKDQYYYVEVIMKEGGGNDFVSVGWKKPGDTTIGVVPGTALRWVLP